MKIPKAKTKQAHTSQTKMGMGDYYGTGITAKIGRMREGTGFEELSKKALRTPPKSLA
jgi:hypothetical protein